MNVNKQEVADKTDRETGIRTQVLIQIQKVGVVGSLMAHIYTDLEKNCNDTGIKHQLPGCWNNEHTSM